MSWALKDTWTTNYLQHPKVLFVSHSFLKTLLKTASLCLQEKLHEILCFLDAPHHAKQTNKQHQNTTPWSQHRNTILYIPLTNGV